MNTEIRGAELIAAELRRRCPEERPEIIEAAADLAASITNLLRHYANGEPWLERDAMAIISASASLANLLHLMGPKRISETRAEKTMKQALLTLMEADEFRTIMQPEGRA